MRSFVFLAGALSLLSGAASAVTTNPELIIGEWAAPQQCGAERIIFTQDGRYIRKAKNGDAWKTTFDGVYVINEIEPQRVIVARGNNMTGDQIDISELNTVRFRGLYSETRWEDEAPGVIENFTYLRCQTR